MNLAHYLRRSILLLSSLAMLSLTHVALAAKPSDRPATPESSQTMTVNIHGKSVSVRVLDRGQGVVVTTADGRVETLHRVGGKLLRVVDGGPVPGATRYDIIDSDALLSHVTPQQLAEAQAQLDALVLDAGITAKGYGSCGLEMAALAVAAASVVASCGAVTPACALAIAGYLLAVEALDRCVAASPIEF